MEETCRNGGEIVVVKVEFLERSEVGKGGERSKERISIERKSDELGESAEIGRKSTIDIEGFSGYLWVYLNLNFRWVKWVSMDLSI